VATDLALTSFQLVALQAQWPPPAVVDVRRAPAFARDPTIIPGAMGRLPEEVARWAFERAPAAAGLLAISLGLSAMLADDHAMLRWGLLTYDSLHAWCRSQQTEQHGWHPEALRAAAER